MVTQMALTCLQVYTVTRSSTQMLDMYLGKHFSVTN